MDDIIKIIPEKWRGTFLVLAVISPYITRAYHAVSTGGGLRSILSSIWFGTNTPKPKTHDDSGIADKLTVLLIAGLLSFGAMATLTGCTTPQTREAIVFNTFKDTWTVAHSAYQAHCENVVNGKVSKEKEIKVDAAWNRFRLVFKSSLAVANQDWSKPAPATLDLAEKQLLQLIRSL